MTKPDPTPRRDGWTVQRQLAFLEVLRRTRSVGRAASAAGMSRESAYRLRARDPDGLFAATWAHVVAPPVQRPRRQVDEGHIRAIRRALGAEADRFRFGRGAASNP